MTEQVNPAVENPTGDGTGSAAVNTPENVSSPEVKVENPNVGIQNNNVDATKLQEQISNLNKALQEERNAGREYKETAKKLESDLIELKKTQEVFEKMKNAFVPEQPVVDEKPQNGLTIDALEEFYNRKEQEKKAELDKEQQVAKIKTEIKNLETQWDGADGKPKYDDKAVLEWQDANGKLHLSPTEAFYEMNRTSLIDWEVKQRMDGKPTIQSVETPGSGQQVREPNGTKPKSDMEVRQAVFEAIDNAGYDFNE